MDFRRIKAVLFVVVFLLVMAVAVNLLVDMQNTRKEVDVGINAPPKVTAPVQTQDVYVSEQPVNTAAPALTPAPTEQPVVIPTPLPTEIVVATPAPTPTPVPTPTPIPVGQLIGNGSFRSETGVPMNIRADWSAVIEDAERVKVTVQVYLESYKINLIAVDRAVNVSVGDSYVSSGAPEVKWDQNVQIDTLMATTEHTLYLPQGSSNSFPVAVEYHFGGTYSKKELPVIECGGSIQLAR